jgi:hypothetical protein
MWWSSWWLVWFVFLLIFIATPVGYGWGYRGWGPPYPSYFQRRREQQATVASRAPGAPGFDHYAWGLGGDFVWMILMIGAFWAGWALWARR